MYRYVLVHTSKFHHTVKILIQPCPLLDTWRYKAVQGSEIGILRYMAVPESPVPLDMQVQGST